MQEQPAEGGDLRADARRAVAARARHDECSRSDRDQARRRRGNHARAATAVAAGDGPTEPL